MKPTHRILVVDDNADGRDSMADLLRLKGYEVRVAADGVEAVALAPGFAPDVVLLDISLPGMDGFEVARRLRALPATAGSLLVALSGFSSEEIRHRAEPAGFDHALTKPIDFAELDRLLGG